MATVVCDFFLLLSFTKKKIYTKFLYIITTYYVLKDFEVFKQNFCKFYLAYCFTRAYKAIG